MTYHAMPIHSGWTANLRSGVDTKTDGEKLEKVSESPSRQLLE